MLLLIDSYKTTHCAHTGQRCIQVRYFFGELVNVYCLIIFQAEILTGETRRDLITSIPWYVIHHVVQFLVFSCML